MTTQPPNMHPDTHGHTTTATTTPPLVAEKPKRRRIDWIAAEAFYLGLDPVNRSWNRVAIEFRCSHTRVAQVGVQRKWREKAVEVDELASAEGMRRVVRSRADRVTKTLKIVDALLDRFDDNVEKLELRPADLHRIVTLAELLEGEATDRVSFSELQEALGVTLATLLPFVPAARRSEAIAAVREKLGAVDGDAA